MALTIGAFTGDMELWGLTLVVPGIAIFIFTALLRRHLSAYSIKIRFNNNLFYPEFKNKRYQQEFDRINSKGIPPSGVINTTIYRM